MARRRRARRYGGPIVTIPGLGALPGMSFLKRSVSVQDAAVGVVAGLAGSAALKAAVKRFKPDAFSTGFGATLGKALPAVMGVATGAALYYAEKKSPRAAGHAVGAALAGLALTVWEFGKAQFAGNQYLDFSEVTQVNFGRYGRPYNGLLINDSAGPGVNGYNGLLVADHSDGLAELAALSMAPDNDGIDALMGM